MKQPRVTGGHFAFEIDGWEERLRVPDEIWTEEENARNWLEVEIVSRHVGEGDEAPSDAFIAELASHLEAGLAGWRPLWAEYAAMRADREDGDPAREALEILFEVDPEPDWIVPGLVARGWVTAIAGREKFSGKSTLIGYLVRRMWRREETVFGPRGPRRVKTLVVTEDPNANVAERVVTFGLVGAMTVLLDYEVPVQRFPGDDPVERWRAKLDYIVSLARDRGCEHVVIDPFTRISGVEGENELQLGQLTDALSKAAHEAKLAFTVVHHAPKGATSLEAMFRGHSSMTAAVEQIIGIWPVGSNELTRKRKLTSKGRSPRANWTKKVELLPDGADYADLGPADDEEVQSEEKILEDVDARRLAARYVLQQMGGSATRSTFASRRGTTKAEAGRALNDLANAEVVTVEVGPNNEKTYTLVEAANGAG